MATLQNAPALHRTWSSLASCQVLLLNQSSGIVCKKYILPAVRACAQGETLLPSKQGPCNCLRSYYAHSIPLITGINGRRQVLAGAWAFTTSIFFRNTALAVEPPDGYGIFVDQPDGYSFLYPSDWRDYVYQGQDAAYKDVIRPLENVRVNYKKTDKKDVHDLGPPDEVAKKLVTKVFAAPNQRTQIFNVKERTAEGKNYYSFDYVVSSPSYSRHCAVTLSIGNGKYYTLIAGALERRWKKMEETLHIVADSFQIFDA